MKSNRILAALAVFSPLLISLSIANAGETPPLGTKPLYTILKSVEDQKLGSISEAEFDDGLWEVKVGDAETCQKIYIDPRTGEEKRRRRTETDELPPKNSLPISAVIQSVEARGLGIVTEFDYDNGFWAVDLRKDGRKIKLIVDPMTGEIRR